MVCAAAGPAPARGVPLLDLRRLRRFESVGPAAVGEPPSSAISGSSKFRLTSSVMDASATNGRSSLAETSGAMTGLLAAGWVLTAGGSVVRVKGASAAAGSGFTAAAPLPLGVEAPFRFRLRKDALRSGDSSAAVSGATACAGGSCATGSAASGSAASGSATSAGIVAAESSRAGGEEFWGAECCCCCCCWLPGRGVELPFFPRLRNEPLRSGSSSAAAAATGGGTSTFAAVAGCSAACALTACTLASSRRKGSGGGAARFGELA
jgi:hypothetical protein